MAADLTDAIKVFYCYAHEDQALRDELEKHLGILRRQGQIMGWHDQDISAGKEWEHEIDTHLNLANIILLLVSPDFIHSEYCYSVEMMQALERHDAGEARVIPIILRPVDWDDAPFSKLQILPANRRPITSWPNPDEAFLDVARGIRKAVKEYLSQKVREQWPNK
jgi:TIR domain-containing protein